MADEAIPEAVKAAWQHATDGWDEAARHDALLAVVAQHSCYAWAAGHYKTRAGDPIADKQLDRLRRAATASMMATATARPDKGSSAYRSTIAMMIVLVLMLLLGLFYVSYMHSHHDAPVPKPESR